MTLAIAAGDVLVAPSTDPAWTPLFLRAGALIMETGGYLSPRRHRGAGIRHPGGGESARHPQSTHDGDQVEVDGNQGTVRRL